MNMIPYRIVPWANSFKHYYVVLLGKNGELLSSSNQPMTKQKCFENIRAQLDATFNSSLFVQDDSLRNPKVYVQCSTAYGGKKRLDNQQKPSAKYIPGENTPTKKKKHSSKK